MIKETTRPPEPHGRESARPHGRSFPTYLTEKFGNFRLFLSRAAEITTTPQILSPTLSPERPLVSPPYRTGRVGNIFSLSLVPMARLLQVTSL